ncbi:MAG: LppX_LprAFG lipoprotein, partial [Anaerolineales bacterium]|nr:LppX_LprAFG lipoprotein [Anaerolineales bacterium]
MPQKAITQLVCFLSTLTLLITGCGTGSIEELPATEIIGRSTERMTSLQGFEFLIQRTGGLAFVDYTQTIAFSRAEGRFNSPDGVAASIRVIGPGLVAEVRIISLGHQQWETNLLSGQWQASDPRYSFNPAALFSPNTGIA